MYYQNYMQDLNAYNQNPNWGYNPYMQNNVMGQGMNQMPMTQNLSTMYPAVYRIIAPVANQVLSNNNIAYITEDSLNSMVDSVYNIVEGDINLQNNGSTENSSTSAETANTNNFSRTNSNQNTNSTHNHSNRQNPLLRDLIKIMLLNDILGRRQNMNRNMFM